MAKANRYVALLRGINVGKAKRISMADLRSIFESLRFTDVSTVLNSGNVVFTSARKPESKNIERAIYDATGIHSRVAILDGATLARVVEGNPFSDLATNPSRYLVAVLADGRDVAKLEPLLESDWTPEAIALGPQVAYLWCPDGILESRISNEVSKRAGDGVTMRNWSTIVRLQQITLK